MTMDEDALQDRLSALKAEFAALRAPAEVDRAIASAIARAERAKARSGRRRWAYLFTYGLPAAFAAAATIAIVAWTLRASPEGETPVPKLALPAASEFIPVVPITDLASTRGAYVVSTPVPRTMLAELGLPINPALAAEPVASELLVRADGTVLAVRFLE
jgi:hypothetical protein